MGVKFEALGLGYENDVHVRSESLSRRTEAGGDANFDASMKRIFDKQLLAGTLLAPWSSDDVLHYNTLEVELWLECEGHQDKNCGPWDFEMNLYLCTPGVTSWAQN